MRTESTLHEDPLFEDLQLAYLDSLSPGYHTLDTNRKTTQLLQFRWAAHQLLLWRRSKFQLYGLNQGPCENSRGV